MQSFERASESIAVVVFWSMSLREGFLLASGFSFGVFFIVYILGFSTGLYVELG
jgi:hypothetical protein